LEAKAKDKSLIEDGDGVDGWSMVEEREKDGEK